ncbi:hypothetical protein [Burkholderia diffusa]|uniref:hypothetical protein n=1 Tax=Burkholderia diffusa TaxID=488732 RepID=UPI0039F53ACA
MKETDGAKRRFVARRAGVTLCFGGMLGGWLTPASAQVEPAGNVDAPTLAPIVVVGTTPLLGIGTPLSRVPANVQTIRGEDITRQHGGVLTDYFEKNE